MTLEGVQRECDVVQGVIENKYYRAEVGYVFADSDVLASEQFEELNAHCDAVIVLDDAQVDLRIVCLHSSALCDMVGVGT